LTYDYGNIQSGRKKYVDIPSRMVIIPSVRMSLLVHQWKYFDAMEKLLPFPAG
jgi:hypothetical protein